MASLPTFAFEDACTERGAQLVAGVDEAGRGPLAGPVVAAAVIIDRACVPDGLADSKTISEARREALAPKIWLSSHVGVGAASVDEIDRLNILQASLLAMRRAVGALLVRPSVCLVDGNQDPGLDGETQTIVRGDARSISIAAASVIAKTTRDRIMRRLAREHPQFAWDANKGYASKAHRDALDIYGPTQHHRKSFAPIRDMLCSPALQESA